ncbi:U3-containing 90S pre-ribosomal complex subunit-domain containing protein [Scheffersomyces amazonensis]|uniref:U3-containing 90S pre-ribosomal complex subunit-domain containing protein n=1 Tax=Scheffersomyces amazonensis TaxID=1078765 RepID=UPI00315D83E5
MPAADDLDDGLSYDVEFSEPEGNDASNSEFENNDESDNEVTASTTTTTTDEVSNEPESKKRKKTTNKLQEKKRLKVEMDIHQKKNLSLESDAQVITDYINNKILRKNSDLSALELSELYFKKSDIRSSSEFSDKRNLDGLSKFITGRFSNMLPESSKKKNKKSKNKNKNKNKNNETSVSNEERKFIAIVSMSAIRACDIHRATKDLSGSSLKVINKNKIEVDLKLLKTTNSRILCCTPGRLLKVLNNEDKAIKQEEIKVIIVDNSYLDVKSQNIWDIKETTDALKELTNSGSKIYLY